MERKDTGGRASYIANGGELLPADSRGSCRDGESPSLLCFLKVSLKRHLAIAQQLAAGRLQAGCKTGPPHPPSHPLTGANA